MNFFVSEFFFYHTWQECCNQMAQFAFIILLMRVQVMLLHQRNAMPLSALKQLDDLEILALILW